MYDHDGAVLLPPQTMSAALQHRDDNERRIGEVFLGRSQYTLLGGLESMQSVVKHLHFTPFAMRLAVIE